MSTKKKRNYTAEFKAKVALCAIKGDITIGVCQPSCRLNQFKSPTLPPQIQRKFFYFCDLDLKSQRLGVSNFWCFVPIAQGALFGPFDTPDGAFLEFYYQGQDGAAQEL